ncbi:MAG: hypothetical protein RLN76_07710 [Phycisphaeraceae bacterium]
MMRRILQMIVTVGLVLLDQSVAWAGPMTTPIAEGNGQGVARYVGSRVFQEIKTLTYAYPTTSIEYQRAEFDINEGSIDGFAGAAGLARTKPDQGVISMSAGTRTETSNSRDFLGDSSGWSRYHDTFDVLSDTLPDGTEVTVWFQFAMSVLDSTNHTASSSAGGFGGNNATNNGLATVRVETDGSTDNLYEHAATHTRNRAGETGSTGVLQQDIANADDDPYNNRGNELVALKAVIGSTLTLELYLSGESDSRVQFAHDANSGFCAALVWGFDVEDGYLLSHLEPDFPIPSTDTATRERATLEIPPGPYPVPEPASLFWLSGLLIARRQACRSAA